MHIHFILLMIFLGYLRRILQTKQTDQHLDKLFMYGIAAAAFFLLLEIIFPATAKFTIWIAFAVLFYLSYLSFYAHKFQPARSFAFAFLPYLVLSIVEEILKMAAPVFYQSWEDYFDVAGIFAFIWLIAMLIVNNKQRKALLREKAKLAEQEKEYEITRKLKAELEVQVAQRTADLEQQKEALERTVQELRATQDQLVHAEKMASLGELTAGIAHEIKNPLNFVNNFSDVSKEMIHEMKAELEHGNVHNATELMSDIIQNLEKIIYHGKRADAIVRSMLQHSRTGGGAKEPTDINELADEYLRLAYHGHRAKDKSNAPGQPGFNVIMKTDFDESINDVLVNPQEIGRVILNLINNAFYACTERKKLTGVPQPGHGTPGVITGEYQPMVTLSTRRVGDTIEISVEDNGSGIPASIKDKIFQPFFTTKPTGQGTGLGLSLAYDIVTKGHGGELKVASEENKGTRFTLVLKA